MVADLEKVISRPHGDCEKCANTYGTLGCCDTISNVWVYNCENGMKQYEINAAYKKGLEAGKKRHATWVGYPDRLRHWHCSECGSVWGITAKVMQYCPNCGARMDMPDEWRKDIEA